MELHFWAIEFINKTTKDWSRLVWYDAKTRKEARNRIKDFFSPTNAPSWEGFKFRIVHYKRIY